MTLSELIEKLQELPAEYADYPVRYFADKYGDDWEIEKISVDHSPPQIVWLEQTSNVWRTN